MRKWMYIAAIVGLADATYLWLVEKIGIKILPYAVQQWYLAAHPPGSSSFHVLPQVAISFAWLGMIGYIAILLMLMLEKDASWQVRGQLIGEAAMIPLILNVLMCLFGIVVTMILATKAIFIIRVVCPLCALSWTCMASLLVLSILRFQQTYNAYVSRYTLKR